MDGKVAIVGIGCRYPGGVSSPGDFWAMLAEGRDCTAPPPDDRFDASFFWHPNRTPGKIYNRCGGYLQGNVFEFDRQFFKIPPDEANHLDPQIQLLLEVAWEALENAGIPPRSIRGSNTGVYMGVTSAEYLTLTVCPFSNISQYTNSGTNSCMVANRISYEFDLHGPSFSVDTACSSSLYSIHLASEAIRKGDCSMALAGGVNLMLLPGTSIGFCQAGMLSPDGKCKSFDASADGYCRSEGAGVVVLKPLSRALADGDRIYAVIRGGTLTNDGRTPGIANPSYDAQLDLVEKACAAASVHPHDIQYVEAHGTGTRVGDRTEANALGQILGRGRAKGDPPLYIGSVKSNFGHTEGAAGVAGIIKLALMISKGQIPRVVHFSSPNPDIHFDMLNIKVPSSLLQWEENGTRLAGCSSFGFGGANAHLILEKSPSPDLHKAVADNDTANDNQQTEGTGHETKTIMLLSGNTKAALKEQVEQWISFITETIASNEDRFQQSLYTAANRYQHHVERLAMVVNGPDEAVQKLNLVTSGEKLTSAVEGKVPEGAERGKMAFVFSGMGTQWWGMARTLALQDPVFRDVIRRFEDELKTLGANWSIVDMLTKETNPEKINSTDVAQPCICAVQMGLVELLKQYDVIPDAIVGHSVGEVAAAYAAGLLSFEDAVRVIYHRGKELSKTSGYGKMLAVLHPIEEVEELVEQDENKNVINVAAANSPNQIVLSGDINAIDGFQSKLKSRDIKSVFLKVNNAFHSYQQEQVKGDILRKLSILSASKRTTEAQIPMISTVTNKWLSPEITNSAHYWWTNIRHQVRFMQSVQVLLREGYSTFVEIGAHPALGPALKDTSSVVNSRTTKQNIIPTLLRPRDTSSPADDRGSILVTTGSLHVAGYPVNFSPAFEEKHRLVHDIPAYPWQRVLCNAGTESSSAQYKFPQRVHPLLGQAQETAEGPNSQKSKVWCSNLTEESVPWLKHHVLDGNVVVPAAAYVETALSATSAIYEDQNLLMLKNLQFKRFMFAPTSEAVMKSTLQYKSAKEKHFCLYSKDASGSWILHATAEVHKGDLTQSVGPTNLLANVAERCSKTISSEKIYEAAVEAGFHLGSSFHCVTSCTATENYEEAVVTAEAPEEISREFARYIYHPAFMDTFLHTFACLSLLNDKYTGKTPAKRVPFSMNSLRMFNKMPSKVTLYFRISKKGQRRVVDITVTEASGHQVVCEVEELMFEDIDAGSSSGIKLWNLQWEPLLKNDSIEEQEPTMYKHVLVLHENERFGTAVRTALQANLGCAVEMMNQNNLSESEDSKKMQTHDNLDHIIVLYDSAKQEQIVGSGGCYTAEVLRSFKCLSAFKRFSQLDPPPTLWIFTRGSSSVQDQDKVSPFLAGVSSLCLSISQEYPQLKVKAVDLAPQHNFADAAVEVLCVLQANPRENEIAARMDNSPGMKHVNLYARRLSMMKPDQILTTCSPNESWSFDPKQRQNGKKLYKAQSNPSTTRRNEARVEVAAFAVCPFADMLGSNDGPAQDIHLICGTVHHTPADMMVQDGSRVMGVVTGCISPQMNIQMGKLVALPGAISWDDAVAIVKDFLPAFSFFKKIQTVCKEDKVVVFLPDEDNKEALAYASLALHKGAEVCVVADTVQNVNTEQHLVFTTGSYPPTSSALFTTYDKVDQDIQDKHASVVFLPKGDRAGDVLQQATRKLQAYGTLVNLGGSTILTEQLPTNIKYITVDPLGSSEGESSLFCTADNIQQLLSTFDQPDNTLSRPIPSAQTNMELSSLSHILHQQQKGLKIPDIVTIDDKEVQLGLDIKQNQFKAVDKATYVVTGGLKGFGLALLEWLTTRGASHLVVLARSEPNEEARVKLEALSTRSVDIKVMKVDVTDKKAVEEALTWVRDTMPPIEGIFHCAAVYEDKLIDQTTQDDWEAVMLPKAVGAVILHDATKKLHIRLKHFVLISSVVALFGNTGQAAYCAANSTLIALGEARRQEGLPATVASLGVINTVGFAERSGLIKLWEGMGVQSISPHDALEILGCMMENQYPHFGITGPWDIRKYCSTHKSMALQHLQAADTCFSRFTTLIPNDVLGGSVSLSDKVLGSTKDNGLRTIQEQLFAYLCQQLGIGDTAEITPETSPVSLGLDSLLSVDMSNEIADKFEVTVTSVELLSDRMTVRKLSESIYDKMANLAGNQGTATGSLTPVVQDEENVWLHFFGKLQDPILTLVCFPANGGGPSLFHQWGEHFSKHNIEVVVATLPGWEGRERESPIDSLQQIVEALGGQIMETLTNEKMAFYGHSMGALIAFEVAHWIRAKGSACPSHLLVGGWYAPSMPYPHPQELRVSPTLFDPSAGTQQITEEAKTFSFLPEAVVNNPTHLRRLLPCLQAGIAICKSYICEHTEPLPCNVVAFGGQDDPFVSPDLLDNWELVASKLPVSRSAFRKCLVQGGHFFITTSRQDVLNKMTSALQEDDVIIQPLDSSRKDTPNVIDIRTKPSSSMVSSALYPVKSTPVIHKAAAYLRYQISHPTLYTRNLYIMFRTQNIPADVDSWRSVFVELMGRHETLRSTYHVSSDVQHPGSGVEARYYNTIEGATDIEVLTGYPPKQAEEAVYQRTKVPFQLDKEYPARCIVAPTGNRSAVIGLVLNHISTDNTSLNILFKDFGEIMRAHFKKKTLKTPMATLTYCDFVQYYYSYLQQHKKQLQDFWRAALPSTVPSINLPFAKPRPLTLCTEGGSIQVDLSKELVHSLKEYAKSMGTTVYSIIATTYQLLLHIYTNHDDIVIACPFDMRMLAPQFSDVHGLFQHPLPLCASFKNKEQSYQQTILQSYHKLQECKKHGVYPIDEIMKLVSYEKHPTMDPIMQHIVVQNDQTGLNKMFNDTGKRITLLKNGYHGSYIDFVLHSFQDTKTKSVSCSIRYAKSLFDEEVAQCMVNDYVKLLSTCLKNPKWSLSKIHNAVEMTALNCKPAAVHDKNDDQPHHQELLNGRLAQEETIHGYFHLQAARTPAACAVSFNGAEVSYKTLEAQSDHLATLLTDMKSSQRSNDDVVTIYMAENQHVAQALLGTWKAGLAVCPLTLDVTQDSISGLTTTCHITAIVTDHMTAAAKLFPPQLQNRILNIDDIWDEDRDKSSTGSCPFQVSKYAFVMTTATMPARLVRGTHAGLLNRLRSTWQEFPHQANDICCLKSPLAGRVDALLELFGPLLQGVPVVVIPTALLSNPAQLLECISRRKITRLSGVHQRFWSALLQELSSTPKRWKQLSLKYIFTDACGTKPSTFSELSRAFPHATIVSTYSTLEVYSGGMIVTGAESTPIDEDTIKMKPMNNTKVTVLGDSGHGQGTLCISVPELSDNVAEFPASTITKDDIPYYVTGRQASLTPPGMVLLAKECKNGDSKEGSSTSSSPDSPRQLISNSNPDEPRGLNYGLLQMLQKGTVVRKMTSKGWAHKKHLQLVVEKDSTANLLWGSSNKTRQISVSSISSLQTSTVEGKPSLHLTTEERDFTFIFNSNPDMESWRQALWTLSNSAADEDSESEDTHL
ncbi:FASN [Branchiostoma lanceolatum]|uniref:Fatty acid synthase n=1 Tax=Branchiostoma lanceolatum TaxID=7740 RepID=A0A8J9ZPV8_BRALA|nr:FASN [Branchiostoma lanceolatum]